LIETEVIARLSLPSFGSYRGCLPGDILDKIKRVEHILVGYVTWWNTSLNEYILGQLGLMLKLSDYSGDWIRQVIQD
jgi:hypothetical protein